MAWHINKRTWVNDPAHPDGKKEVIDYFIDTEADKDNPPADKAGTTSTAFCPSSGRAAVLMPNGWQWMA